jgi:Na+:H+ antiporter, NhaA family
MGIRRKMDTKLAQQNFSDMFQNFFDSEKSGGILLVICTAISLVWTNSPVSSYYLIFWQKHLGGLSLEHWINDALMAIFFLFIGLELERELYVGELSKLKNALLPIFAAVGGMIAPALIHYFINMKTPTQAGIGIPMATDIAFVLGVMSMLGNRLPNALKVFTVAFAIIDDLGAIIIIAVFYTSQISIWYFFGALMIWILLIGLNRLHVLSLFPYLFGGALMWFFMLKSGVHATIAGIMLAFAIPFSTKVDGESSPSHQLEHFLHKPVAFIILPIFALANTGILVNMDWLQNLTSINSFGIIAGLLLGKPLGIILLCFVAVSSNICHIPSELNWRHLTGAGILGGIGFTMSIFITNLAYPGNPETINASKIAVLVSSLIAGLCGFLWLKYLGTLTREDDITHSIK